MRASCWISAQHFLCAVKVPVKVTSNKDILPPQTLVNDRRTPNFSSVIVWSTVSDDHYRAADVRRSQERQVVAPHVVFQKIVTIGLVATSKATLHPVTEECTRGQLDHFTWPPILALSASAHSLSRNHLEDSNFFTEIHPPHAVTNSKIERIDSEVNSPWVHVDITFKQKPKSQELTQEVKLSNGHYKPEY